MCKKGLILIQKKVIYFFKYEFKIKITLSQNTQLLNKKKVIY